MGKSKRGPALFELLSDDVRRTPESGRAGIPVPRWWTSRSATHSPRPANAAATGVAPPLSPPAGEDGIEEAVNDEELVEKPGGSDRLVELDGDRVRLSLTSVGAAGVVFLAVLLIVAAFALGGRRGDRIGFRRGYDAGRVAMVEPPLTEVEAVRSQPPATHIVGGLLTERSAASPALPGTDNAGRTAAKPVPSTPAGTSSDRPEWVRDYTYIVVQEFSPKNAEDAQRAREFLAKRGIATAIVKLESGVLQLITSRGYNRKDAAQKRLADQTLEKQRALGAEYYLAGGGYKLEGYFKTLKRDTW